jgi:anoctamin-1
MKTEFKKLDSCIDRCSKLIERRLEEKIFYRKTSPVPLPAVNTFLKISKAFDNLLTLPFAFLISVWGVLYVQWWIRRNRFLVIQWNMTDFSKEEKPRPAWKATRMKTSPVSGRLEPHFPTLAKKVFRTFTISLTALMLLVTVFGVESYILYNAWLASYLRNYYPELAYWASFTSAAISLVTGMLLSIICRWLSLKCVFICSFFHSSKIAVNLS